MSSSIVAFCLISSSVNFVTLELFFKLAISSSFVTLIALNSYTCLFSEFIAYDFEKFLIKIIQ